MEGNKVEYITREQIRDLDPSQIASMTMTSGSIIVFNHDGGDMNYYAPQARYQMNQNVVLRAKKGENAEEEEKVELGEALPQEETGNKQVLRGKDGKPILMDIITGNNIPGENQLQPEEQPQMAENPNQENSLHPQQEQNNQQYYEQGMNQVGEQQMPEQNPKKDNIPPQEQVSYPPEQNQPIYPPPEMNQNNTGAQIADPNVPNQNQNYQEAFEPVPRTNIPTGQEQEQGGYVDPNAAYYDQTQGQGQMPINPVNQYPEFDDEVPQPEFQPNPKWEMAQKGQSFQPEYYQENIPQVKPSGNQPPQEYPHPSQRPAMIPPSQFLMQQPTNPLPQPPVRPPHQPIQTQFRPFIPGVKGFPKISIKKPKVRINLDFGRQPFGIPIMRPTPLPPHGMPMPYPGPPRMHPKNTIVIDPIGSIMNAVNRVTGPIIGGVRLRSTKPNANKNVQKEDGKQEDPVLRARRRDDDYNNDLPEQVLCPECSQKYGNTYGYSQCEVDYSCQTYQNQSKIGSDNFNFFERVETSDNSKSYVVAKKGGVTVSYDK